MTPRTTPTVTAVPTDTDDLLRWRTDDAPAGTASLRLYGSAGQAHLAALEIDVRPEDRRRGAATALLGAAVDAAREHGRRTVLAQAEAGSPADAFLAARGFRAVLTLLYARLPLADADPAAMEALVARPHPGYRLVSWVGTVPDALLETFTASRRAMDDMPMDDTDFGTVTWDTELVRTIAEKVAARGELLHTVAAVDESDGSIAGFTELVVPRSRTGDAQHYGTGVLPEHRRRGLAAWMKAESIRWALTEQPSLEGLLTDTARSNTGMRAVNDALGYRLTHTSVQYQLEL
ncbi:GNAT family N-acetyltransferase [Kitasatospora terrestris]|uniref:GNAT family N-acetyltransferase n=1 Tax=Kitasatospora terrestris TaxID=258051 RepID=A0ABP9ENL4_9ACTN